MSRSSEILMYNNVLFKGYLLIGVLEDKKVINATFAIDENMYQLAAAIVSVSLFDADGVLVENPTGGPKFNITFPVEVCKL